MQSVRLARTHAARTSLHPQVHFSQYFKDLDKASWKEINSSFCGSKAYTRAVNMWKLPLIRKQLKKARKEANPPVVQPPEESGLGSFYVHNTEVGVTLPQHPEQIFAVLRVKGNQFKVVKDDRVIMESLGEEF